MSASFACLIHCLILPLAIAALPALAKLGLIPAHLHIWILAFAVPAAAFALASGRSQHGRTWPLCVGTAGLGLLAIGALVLGESILETITAVTGSILLAVAHIANWRMRHAGHCH